MLLETTLRLSSYAFFDKGNFAGRGLENWNVSSLEAAAEMFWNNTVFNQALGSWDVSKLRNFQGMFQSALAFNQPLANWNVRSAVNMDYMFEGAFSFNQDLSPWDVSGVQTMRNMFGNATAFNQNLCLWGEKVNAGVNVSNMFGETACEDEGTPDLTRVPSGPWCVFCGSPQPASSPVSSTYRPTGPLPTAVPTITPSPTRTMEPTGPTEAPTSVERNVTAGNGSSAMMVRLDCAAAVLFAIVSLATLMM